MSLQVLRYSALGAGIFYGLYHQAKLSSSAKLAAINREYEHKQSLIEKAKAEYSKKNLPPSAKTEGEDSTFDPLLSRFYPLAILGPKEFLGSAIWPKRHEIVEEGVVLNIANGVWIVISDPNDSKFDLEAYLNKVAAEHP